MMDLFTSPPGEEDPADTLSVLKALSPFNNQPPQAAPASAPIMPPSQPVDPAALARMLGVQAAQPSAPAPTRAPTNDKWKALLDLVGPLTGMFAEHDPISRAAFINSWQDAESAHKKEEQAKKDKGANYLLEVGQHAATLTDPGQFEQFLRLAEDAGTRAGWIKPGEIRNAITFPTSQFAAAKIQELSGELDTLEKSGYNLDELANAGAQVQLKDGTKVPVSTALDLTRKRPISASGQAVARPNKADTAPPTDFSRYVAKYAKERGKTVDQLTTADEDAARTQFNSDKSVKPPPPPSSETERAAALLGQIRDAKAKGDTATATTLQAQYDDLVKVRRDGQDPMIDVLRNLQAENMRLRNTTSGPSGGLTDDAIDYAATQWRVTGVMPALGRSGQGRSAIVNRAAQQVKDLGQSPAVAIQKQAAYKADSASLTKITEMSSAAESFETKALQQADIVESLSNKVARTQYPIINDGLLTAKARIAGDSNTQLLYNALATFTTEYAKIMEGATGSSAATSISARDTAAKLVLAGLNKGTLSDTIALMKREMALTIQGYDATKAHITERMGGAPAVPQTAPRRQYYDANGNPVSN